jgi:bla regulator protein BlaR1
MILRGIFAAALAIPAALIAQEQQPAKEFEVASIKPAQSADARMTVRLNPGGRWVGRNVPVTLLIQEGFDVRQSQISGGPSWVGGERFDIEAKPESSAAGGPSSEALSLMFQSLLTSRFHLEYHRETKDVQAYSLSIGKHGIKMKESEANPDAKPAISVGPNRFKAVAMPMQMLANTLSLGRLVVDETGLKGSYDVTLEWAPDAPLPDAAASGHDPMPAVRGDGLTIFTAVQEQLGLTLDSKKVPVQMFVIDRLDHPEAN